METSPIKRPYGFSLRRHALLFLGVMCLLSSAFFLAVPMLRRTYELRGTMQVKGAGFEGIPELKTLPARAVEEVRATAGKATIALQENEGGTEISIAAAGPTRDAAVVQVQGSGDRIATALRLQWKELTDGYRGRLMRDRDRLRGREEQLVQQIEMFRGSHRGVLPDDPSNVTVQFEKLGAKLDEKRQRLRIVTEQVTRLDDYKKRVAAGAAGIAPPPVLAPAASTGTAAAPKPENDPEVITLTGQLQLVNDQIDEQLNTLRRTEQHPYVVDLRTTQVAIQKKLEAVKQRVAAGQAPPAEIRSPINAGARGNDPTLAAAQQVELQLQALQAEQSALEAEVRELTSQKTVMQKDVDAVVPARREFEGLNEQLAAVRKDRQELKAKIDAFEKQFGTESGPEMGAIEVSPLTYASASTLPTFPRLSLIYPAGLIAGLLLAAGSVWIVHRRDDSFHDQRELAAVIDVPVVGVISEIHTPGRRELTAFWRKLGRPLVAAGLILLLLMSGLTCFRGLAEPQRGSAMTLTNLFGAPTGMATFDARGGSER